MSVVIVVGNPKAGSRTLQAAELVVAELVGRDADLTLDLASSVLGCWTGRTRR